MKGGRLDFWALKVQPWGSYQKDKEINPGLLPGCLLIVNIPMRCSTEKPSVPMLGTVQISTNWFKKNPQTLSA